MYDRPEDRWRGYEGVVPQGTPHPEVDASYAREHGAAVGRELRARGITDPNYVAGDRCDWIDDRAVRLKIRQCYWGGACIHIAREAALAEMAKTGDELEE